MLLVTQVEGPDTAAVRHVARYRCTGFNQSRPEAGELSRINWLVSAAGRTIAEFPARGAVLEFAPMDDLEGCTITVQPYRNRPSAQVGVTTRVTRGARPLAREDARPPAAPGPGARPGPGAASGSGAASGAAPAPARPSPAAPAPRVALRHAGNRFYARVNEGPERYVGTEVTYLDRRGLMNVEAQAGAVYAAEAHRHSLGHWAEVIVPTAMAESRGAYTCLNTYDRAAFTFGFLQWAAHTPNANFVCLLRKLLALPSAATLFPELTLVDGRVALRGGGGPRLLESDQSTAPLMAWLNDTPDSVDRDEAQVAARFVDWALGYAEHRQAQVDFAVAEAKRAMAGYARRYGLDGAGDELLVAVADIRHQGRAGSAQILTALRAADPLDALLRLGAERYPTRCATLRSEIDKLRRQGRLGRLVFDAARTAWVARLDVS